MILDISDKVIGVTGAAQGIGAELAVALAKEGCNVAVCDINMEKLAITKERIEKCGAKAFAGFCDMSDEDNIRSFVAAVATHFNRIDGWVNNAGIGLPGDLMEVKAASWDKVFSINTRAVLLCAQALFPYLRESKGTIINAASWGGIMPRAGLGVYGASKAAVISLNRTLAAELAPYGIRVCAYAPGIVVTGLTEKDVQENPKSFVSSIALQRPGKSEDLAGVVIFLLSDAASYITGTTIDISGGKFAVQNVDLPWGKLGL